MNSGFCCKADESSILKGYYAVSSGNSLAMFPENLTIPSPGDLQRWD